MSNLNLFDQNRRCPKCASSALTNQHFNGAHRSCCISTIVSDVDFYSETLRFMGAFVTQGMYDHYNSLLEKQDEVPEHIERTCVNCKYVWAEEPLG